MKRKLVEKITTEGVPIPAALKAVDLPASTHYYRAPSGRRQRSLDSELVAAIRKVRQGHAEVYGYRRITKALAAVDVRANGKKVLRHLRALGLTQPRKVKGERWTHPAQVTLCPKYLLGG